MALSSAYSELHGIKFIFIYVWTKITTSREFNNYSVFNRATQLCLK